MTTTQQEALRSLPAVHRILQHRALQAPISQYSQPLITDLIQNTLSEIRIAYRQTKKPAILNEEQVVERVLHAVHQLDGTCLKPVINMTGVVLHTNLGRAVLSEKAVKAIQSTAATYSNLEYDLHQGKRGSRHAYVERLLSHLTGAEAALVVNNNAAAVWLVLREFARNREVIVSRGQLVEIGGSFRVSEIMGESGARLREVGTTNKTHLQDYKQAINDNTVMLMKVHTSNFAFVGFHQEVPREQLTSLAKENHLIFYEDLGSGMLYDLKQHGIGNEPTVRESVEAGCDLVSFSGDKLLGGPQAGLIVGKKQWIERLKKNQLARAVRIDKLSLAGLASTLEAYLTKERAVREIPTLRSILMDKKTVREKALQLANLIEQRFAEVLSVSVHETTAEAGGGSLPGVSLPSYAVRLDLKGGKTHQLEQMLRTMPQPVVGRLAEGALWWDPRTLQPGELEQSVNILGQALKQLNG